MSEQVARALGRIILSGTEESPVTWIEGERLYTINHEVAAAWEAGVQERKILRDGSRSMIEWEACLPDWYVTDENPVRISLTDAREVYRYADGEPWVTLWSCCGEEVFDCIEPKSCPGDSGSGPFLHRRAALVCDTAEQFRALAEKLEVKGE